MQLARAYAIIANDGMEVQPYAVTAVVDENSKVIEGHELAAEQVISPELAYMMQFMLEQVINHGTGAGARTMGFTASGGRQDRHDQRRQGRVVRRLHAEPADCGVDRFRSEGSARADRRASFAAGVDQLS